MQQVVFALILMSFLLWSYRFLSGIFIAKEPAAPKNPKFNLLSIKRIGILFLLFLGCYFLVAYATYNAKNDLLQEIHQHEVFQQTERQQQIEEQEIVTIFEQSKNRAQDKEQEIRVIGPDEIKTKFNDVAGLSEAKDEVQDVIRYLKSPEEFGRLGAKPPKGVLLYGDPGTGKTLMARAMAGEAGVSFIAMAGSEFDEEYIGVGAARVRKLFEIARQHAPCIIFIDEVDALAHKRHAHDPGWSAQTVNQLLAEMDGLDNSKNEGIIIIGATNRLSAMDDAVLRPGRLDRHIKLEIPTLPERVDVLKIYLNKVKTHAKVNINEIAKMTPGFSSAELANLVNEAAIIATKAGKKSIEQSDFDAAKDRIVMGSKREALKISEKTRQVTAYHEAGHALVGHLLGNQPVYKVTITPRGQSLGHTSFEPKADFTSISKTELEAKLTMLLAGRIAEEIVFGEQNITTGAEGDLKVASDLAYNMVTRWGFSKRVGLIHNAKDEIITSTVIEEEVQLIMQKAQVQATELITKNRAQLNKIAAALLEHETLDTKDIKKLLGPQPQQAPR